jgi:hypothetical protein
LIIRGGPGALIPTMSSAIMTWDGPTPTFTLFPNLLTELQIKIWEYALPGPRTIRVHYYDGSFSFGARPPAALYTCRTSREVAGAVFKCAFPLDDKNKNLPPIYTDLVYDTIYLTASSDRFFAFQAFTRSFPDIAKIQSLAVEPSLSDITLLLSDIILSFSCPREIVLVVGYPSQIYMFPFPEHIKFSEPEGVPWLSWPIWKDMDASLKRAASHDCVVRVMEAKIV